MRKSDCPSDGSQHISSDTLKIMISLFSLRKIFISGISLYAIFGCSAGAATIHSVCHLDSPMAGTCPAVKDYLNRPVTARTEFEQYKGCSKAEFELFKAEQQCEFAQYVANAEAEFQAYKKQVGAMWDDPEFSNQTQWVSYSPSLKTKQAVDFANNRITITRIEDQPVSEPELKKALLDTTQLTVAQAQKADSYIGKLVQDVAPETLSHAALLPVSENAQENQKAQQELLDSATITRTKDSHGRELVTIEAPFPKAWLNKKEQPFLQPVNRNASRFDLDPTFVLAIIRTESSFNPTAISHIPAFGLMQIVPTSAGLDSTDYLFGEQRHLSREYLFIPENNIEVGSAYFYLLNHRYFSGIKSRESLKYCSIAAYNGGMRPIYQLFGHGSRKAAIAKINTLKPVEVYQSIIKHHPAVETRNYLKRVTQFEKQYQRKQQNNEI